MKRRRTTLIILVVLLAVLAVLYVGLKLPGGGEEETQATETTTLISLDSALIQKIAYTYEGETITLIRADGSWQLEGDAEFPLNSQTAELMQNCISSVTSTIPVESAGDDALFGLDTPSLTVTATLEDGSEHTLLLGDFNGFNNRYYARAEGVDGIYMIDGKYYRYFAHSLTQLAVPDSIPAVRTANITSVAITNGDSQIRLEAYDAEAPQVYSDSYDYVTTAPDGTPMGAEPNTAAALVTLTSGLSTESCHLYGAEQADFLACGLDGSRTITMDYINTEGAAASWTITLGDVTEDGTSIYVRVGDSSMICLMQAAGAQSLLAVTPDQVRTAGVCDLSLSEMESLTLTLADGRTAAFTIDWQGAHTADYFLDGQELTSDSFKGFFTTISTLKSIGFAAPTETETLLLQVNFNRSTEAFSQVTLTVYDRGDGTCRVEFAGMTTQLVERTAVDTILTALDALTTA